MKRSQALSGQAGIMRGMGDDESNSSRVRMVAVSADHAGRRIDNFLLGELKGVPRTRIYRILRKGEVRVNKGRIRPGYRLQTGDQVRIPPVRVAPRRPLPEVGAGPSLEDRVVYEDPRLLVLNKPAGMAVHGGSGLSYGVIELLRAERPEAHYLELVHRLDRETSGLLIIAKKRSALRTLHEQLRERQLGKRYLALVAGHWSGGHRRVDAPLRKNVMSSGERIVRVDTEHGKESRSRFTPRRVFADAALVSVDIETGRTHQIRVHAAHIGHPLAGDGKYGDAEFNQRLRALGLKRLFLHAARLELPRDDAAPLAIEAPLDDALQAVLERLDAAD